MPPVGRARENRKFIQVPSPEIWSETISGSDEVVAGEVGQPVFGLPPWKKYRRRGCAHLVPPNVGCIQQSPAVRRRAILPIGSTGGPGHSSRCSAARQYGR